MRKYLSYAYVILGAVCWGFIGVFNRLLGSFGSLFGSLLCFFG